MFQSMMYQDMANIIAVYKRLCDKATTTISPSISTTSTQSKSTKVSKSPKKA